MYCEREKIIKKSYLSTHNVTNKLTPGSKKKSVSLTNKTNTISTFKCENSQWVLKYNVETKKESRSHNHEKQVSILVVAV